MFSQRDSFAMTVAFLRSGPPRFGGVFFPSLKDN